MMRQSHEEIYTKVCECLETRKVYLDPNLSLARFSAMIGTNTTYLSNTINDRFGKNFHTLINDYRIRYVVELLKNGEKRTELHTLCGYLAKSSFYDAFQKRMGMSPQRYQRMLAGDESPES